MRPAYQDESIPIQTELVAPIQSNGSVEPVCSERLRATMDDRQALEPPAYPEQPVLPLAAVGEREIRGHPIRPRRDLDRDRVASGSPVRYREASWCSPSEDRLCMCLRQWETKSEPDERKKDPEPLS